MYDMVEEAGDQHAIEKVRDSQNGYEAKRIGNRIKKLEEWNNHKLGNAGNFTRRSTSKMRA